MSLYSTLLIFHSYYRWFVVLLLIFQITWFAYHSFRHTRLETSHLNVLILCAILYDIQFLVGWVLYFQSTLAQQFWIAPAAMVKLRDVRFFGIEHVTMMSLAILAINFLVWKSSRRIGHRGAFVQLLKWYIVLLLTILASIPWSFSPFTHRPDFR